MVMTKLAGRWLDAFGVPALVCALLTFGTGCGAIKAAANPKVAWALNDPAPMSVVVRRADVAEKTSKEVDRLMTDTPANDDSPWLAKVAPDKEAATKDMTDLKSHDLYIAGARVVAAEAWAKELAQVEPKNAKPAAAAAPAAAAPAPATPAAPAAAVAQNEPAAPTAKEAKGEKKSAKGKTDKTVKKDKKDKKGGKKSAKEAKGSEKAADEAVATTAASTAAPAAANTANTATASETATPAAAPTPAKYTSLLAAIDPSLGTEWAKIMEKKKAMGDAKSQIAVLESANDQKGISDADKKANKAKIADLEKSIDALEKDADKLSKEFIPKAKAAAGKAPAEAREKFGPVLVHLRQAVDDANISNSAAAIRYPMAATTLLDSAKQMAKVYVADVIEEKTGKRPSTQALEPGVTMEGGKVQVTLNGLNSADMGKISAGELTTEVASRTTAWAKRALGLLGVISATKDVLSFEEDVLVNLIEGFTSAGWKAPAPATIPEPPAGPGAQPRA
jgi:hypothetical protein